MADQMIAVNKRQEEGAITIQLIVASIDFMGEGQPWK